MEPAYLWSCNFQTEPTFMPNFLPALLQTTLEYTHLNFNYSLVNLNAQLDIEEILTQFQWLFATKTIWTAVITKRWRNCRWKYGQKSKSQKLKNKHYKREDKMLPRVKSQLIIRSRAFQRAIVQLSQETVNEDIARSMDQYGLKILGMNL